MAAISENIKRINDKLQQLLKNHQQLQKDNERQTKRIKELQENLEKDRNHLLILEEKVSILKAATGKMNDKDKKAFEKNINQYIKEIDKCIGVLSSAP